MSSLTATRTAARHLSLQPVPRRLSVLPTPVPAREAGRVRRGVRLTTRGRLLVLLTLVLLLCAAFVLGRGASSSQATQTTVSTPALEQLTVQPGDSLWSVARRIAPARDPREVVAQLRRLNDLPDANLQVGQQLLLPAAA